MPEKKALIITGNLVQDHEFIYPFYRLLEDGVLHFVLLNRTLLQKKLDILIPVGRIGYRIVSKLPNQ